MLASGFFAFTEYDVLTSPRWVGWANFDKALTDDPKERQSVKVTSIYAVVSVPLQIAFGLFLALLLNARIRGLQFYRTIYYLPSVLSGVAVALDLRPQLRAHQLLPGAFRYRRSGLARRPGLGSDLNDRHVALARRRWHRHLPGGPARRADRALRGRLCGWQRALGLLLAHYLAHDYPRVVL